MRKIIYTSIMTVLASSAFASNGNPTGCYSIGLIIPKALKQDSKLSLIDTGILVCTSEKNMVVEPTNDQLSTGSVKIEITQNGKVINKYILRAAFGEGTTGTSYTIYGKTKEDVSASDGSNNRTTILFRMTNDTIKVGERAGSISIGGDSEMELIQR